MDHEGIPAAGESLRLALVLLVGPGAAGGTVDDREGDLEGLSERPLQRRCFVQPLRLLFMPAPQLPARRPLGLQMHRARRALVAREAVGVHPHRLVLRHRRGLQVQCELREVARHGRHHVAAGIGFKRGRGALHFEALQATPVQVAMRQQRALAQEADGFAHGFAVGEEVVDLFEPCAAAMAGGLVHKQPGFVSAGHVAGALEQGVVQGDAVDRQDRGVMAADGGLHLSPPRATGPIQGRARLQQRPPELLDVVALVGACVPVVVPLAVVSPAVDADGCGEEVGVAKAEPEGAGPAHRAAGDEQPGQVEPEATIGVADDGPALDVADALIELRPARIEVDKYPTMPLGPLLLKVREVGIDGPAIAVGMENGRIAIGRGRRIVRQVDAVLLGGVVEGRSIGDSLCQALSDNRYGCKQGQQQRRDPWQHRGRFRAKQMKVLASGGTFCYIKGPDARWSSPVARKAHNLEVRGSNPLRATKLPKNGPADFCRAIFFGSGT